MGWSVPELVLALSSLLLEVSPSICSTYMAGETLNRRWLTPQLLLQRSVSFQALERPEPETIWAYARGLVSAAIAVPLVGMQQALGSSDNT